MTQRSPEAPCRCGTERIARSRLTRRGKASIIGKLFAANDTKKRNCRYGKIAFRPCGRYPDDRRPLYKNILLFSVPLIFSQLLQVLFNMADVAVVGKFSSATALGSVGSTSTLVTLFTGFLIGLSNGVNVRVAQYLGARQEEDTRNCVHTALILCTLSGVVIAVLFAFSWPRRCWSC